MASVGTYRFLHDHYVNDELIQAGTIREMFSPWTPTADVEPLDAVSTLLFWTQGPVLGAVIRTQFQPFFIYKPATYWYQAAPDLWVLAGLGAYLGARSVFNVGRILDKW